LADQTNAPIAIEEFHKLNQCVDDATAEAVAEYTRLREHSLMDAKAQCSGIFAREMRNRVSDAILAFSLLTEGNAAVNGGVGAVVARNLRRLSALIDRSLAEAGGGSGNGRRQRVAGASSSKTPRSKARGRPPSATLH
jgi:hypothetical protein